MKKTGIFVLAMLALALSALPAAASAQSYYANYPYYQSGYSYPNYNYDYDYNRYYDRDDDVVCVPEQQTVHEGERAYFVAYGGDGEYDWRADGRTYRDAGTRFSHVFDDEGTETVRVESDDESDTCRVRVLDRRDYYPYPSYPTYPTSYTAPVTVAATYVPQALPNTGFPPVSSAALAFAVVLLLGAGIVLTPYAKKAITAVR